MSKALYLLLFLVAPFCAWAGTVFPTGVIRPDTFSPPMRITLNSVAGAGVSDQIIFSYSSTSTIGFDASFDARKLQGGNIDLWMTPQPGLDLTVNYVPMPASSITMPVNLRSVFTGSHTFTFSGYQNLTPFGLYVSFWDSTTRTSYDLATTTTVDFNIASAPQSISGRFFLKYGNALVGLKDAISASQPKVYPNPASATAPQWYVSGAADWQHALPPVLPMVSASGQVIQGVTVQKQGNDWVVAAPPLAAGVYTVMLPISGKGTPVRLVVQ